MVEAETMAGCGLGERALDRLKLLLMSQAESFITLVEEMMDLKLQRYAETHLKLNPELNHILAEKRETDRRRLLQIRAELVRFLDT
jgi:hypothetical protein